MNLSTFVNRLQKLLLLAIIAEASVSTANPAYAQGIDTAQPQGVQFECVSNMGTPTTIVISPNGEKPLISWKSTYFSNDGWTPESRCKEVTARISRAYASGTLNYSTTGRINNMPVICSATSEGGSCQSLIYTLKPQQNPGATLKALLKVRAGEGGPIEETTSRIYIPLTRFTGGREFNQEKAISTPLKKPGDGNLF